MILAVNIGNTNIRAAAAGYDTSGNAEIITQTIFYADGLSTEAHIAAEIEKGLGADIWGSIEGSIIATVVPQQTSAAVTAITGKTGHRVKRIDINNCGGLRLGNYKGIPGEDRIVCCAHALKKYPPPFIVIDFGTATTVNVVNANGEFIGGSIFAGLHISLEALVKNTAQLPAVGGMAENLSTVKVIGNGTEECLLSGAIIGLAAAAGGFVSRIKKELNGTNKELPVIITGGHARVILPHYEYEYIHEPDLLLEGLFSLYTEIC
jgi:type III pantothenate kinase